MGVQVMPQHEGRAGREVMDAVTRVVNPQALCPSCGALLWEHNDWQLEHCARIARGCNCHTLINTVCDVCQKIDSTDRDEVN